MFTHGYGRDSTGSNQSVQSGRPCPVPLKESAETVSVTLYNVGYTGNYWSSTPNDGNYLYGKKTLLFVRPVVD